MQEVQRILAVVHGRRNAARWAVALAIGLRQGEALGLRWDYLDVRTGEIRAWFQLSRAEWRHGCADPNTCGAAWHQAPCPPGCRRHRHQPTCAEGCIRKAHTCPKRTCNPGTCVGHADRCPQRAGGEKKFRRRKGRKEITVHCPPELLPALIAHKEVQDLERSMAGDTWQDWGLVFCHADGRPIDRSDDYKEWKAIIAAAGVRDLRLHDARHTCGALMVEQGVHIRTIQEALGHARVTTTQRYTGVASPQLRDAAAGMGAALWGQVTE